MQHQDKYNHQCLSFALCSKSLYDTSYYCISAAKIMPKVGIHQTKIVNFIIMCSGECRNAAAGAAVEGRRWRRGVVEVRLAPRWSAPVGATNTLPAVALATPPLFHLSTRRQAALHRAMRRIKKERSPMECHQRPVMGFFRVYYDCGCPHAA